MLYRNNGDGTFTDVTLKSGIVTPGWASSALWFDYDNDGRLDLFVCRFVELDKAANKFCGNGGTGERHYCIPRVYPPAHSWLFHNNGDGTFTDVSVETGISSLPGKVWGAVATDINNDGWMDLFVANDTVPDFLWVNRQGKFRMRASRPASRTVPAAAPGRGWVWMQPTSTRMVGSSGT